MSFSGLLYPDNDDRANRAEELGSDIENLQFELQQAKESVETLLTEANDVVNKAYAGLIPDDEATVESVNLAVVPEVENWITVANISLTPIVAGIAANKALTRVFTAYLLKNGRIGEAAFRSLVGFPKWIKIGTRLGGIASGVAVAFGVQLIIDSVTGAVQRDKLRDAITEALGPRLEYKHDTMIASAVEDSLKTVISSFSAVAGAGLDKTTLDLIMANIITQNEVKTSAITVASARTELQALDKSRGSWTNEDGSW